MCAANISFCGIVAEYFHVEPSNIYLLHDELDKRVGVSRMKDGGSPRCVAILSIRTNVSLEQSL